MSSSDLSDLLREEYVKVRVKEVLDSLVAKMDKVVKGYLRAAQIQIIRYYGIKPVMEVDSSMFEYGVEYRITLYIDPSNIKKIEEIARRELEDRRVRIKALRKILAQELKSTSGEEDAILQVVHRGSREGVEEAGGGGAKVLGKKRRSTRKSSNKDII
jgi:hypothetical protein